MDFLPYYYSKTMQEIAFSKSFIKQAKTQLIPILNSKIGEIFDQKKAFINFNKEGSDGKEIRYINNITIFETSWLGINPHYGFRCILCFENLKGVNPIPSDKENIESNEIRFWVEDLDVDSIRKHLINYAHYYRKAFIQGYRFVVEVKNPNTYFNMKILFNGVISDENAIEIEKYISNHIVNYNLKEEKNKSGFIKQFYLLSFKKKDFINFYIDIDTAGENGLNEIIKVLSDSNFDIRKLEFDGK
jgi:hypothetical protein